MNADPFNQQLIDSMEIPPLIYGHIVNILNPDEEKKLNAWVDASEANKQLFDELTAKGALAKDYYTMQSLQPHFLTAIPYISNTILSRD